MNATKVPRIAGETTITGKNQVSLPAKSVKELGWERGDRLIVEILGDDMLVLVKRPDKWAEAFAGQLTNVFGTHEETVRWLDGERGGWHVEVESDGRGAR